MCRNIRVLHHFQPPTTREEIHAAALQYVRKVTGFRSPRIADQAVFDQSVADVAAITERVLGSLTAPGPERTREGEKEKAKLRFQRRLGQAAQRL
jgi:hypothetical protein